MPVGEFWVTMTNFIKPIKTIFGFYIVIYLLPLGFIISIGIEAKKHLFIDGSHLNIPAAIIIGICIVCAILWSIFYLLYFTSQRTKNPKLYNRGFLSEFKVKDKEDEFTKK